MNDAQSVYDKFLKFRAVIIQAIALAWKDDKFDKLLNDNPKGALKDAFNYTCPFDIDMKANPNNALWKSTVQGNWVVCSQNELQLVLPPKPEHKCDEPYALADYNTNHLTFLNS